MTALSDYKASLQAGALFGLPAPEGTPLALKTEVTPKLDTAALPSAVTAYLAALPVYSGTGPAPVPTGQPFLDGGAVKIAQ